MNKYNFIDDMELNNDVPHIEVPVHISLDIKCNECNSNYPVESAEWEEDGFYITIKPHICEWLEVDHDVDKCKRLRKLISSDNQNPVYSCSICDDKNLILHSQEVITEALCHYGDHITHTSDGYDNCPNCEVKL